MDPVRVFLILSKELKAQERFYDILLIPFQENADIFDFELSPAEVNRLKKLDKGENGRIFNFLFWKGVENHPEYPFKHLLGADKIKF